MIDVAPASGWRRAIAPLFNQVNHRLAGWKPPGPDLIGTFSDLSPITGMQRLPPLGVWMLLWVEKLGDGAAQVSVVEDSVARAQRELIPRFTGHL